MQFQRQIRRDGIRRTLEMLRQTSWRQWGTLWDAPAGLHQRAGRNNQPPAGAGGLSKQARFEQISKRVQQLPTETFMSKEDLEALPLQDLKVMRGSAETASAARWPGHLWLSSFIMFLVGQVEGARAEAQAW